MLIDQLVGTPKRISNAFSFAYYREMLECAIEKDFRISSFENYSPNYEKTIILRHDIDYNLNGLHKIASMEHKLGITATYLFRVHAHEYNIFSHYVYSLIIDLHLMGHEIGLHTEAMTFARALKIEDPSVVLKQEKLVLESIIGFEVVTVSEHRDVSHTVHNTPYFHDFYNPHSCGFKHFAMSDKYYKDMKYLSDSNGVWREGDLMNHIDNQKRFQILIHPEWWYENDLLLKGPYFHGLGN